MYLSKKTDPEDRPYNFIQLAIQSSFPNKTRVGLIVRIETQYPIPQ
jgi:hypothetical protein